MIQHVLVFLLSLGALIYLAVLAYRAFRPQRGCATGCATCAGQPLRKPTPSSAR